MCKLKSRYCSFTVNHGLKIKFNTLNNLFNYNVMRYRYSRNEIIIKLFLKSVPSLTDIIKDL